MTLISTSPFKKSDAQRLGADNFLVSRDGAQLAKAAARFDFILDTVSASHDLAALSRLLRLDGTLVLLGIPSKPFELGAFELIEKRRSIAGSLVGGPAETQEMLDFCAERGIVADVETIPMLDVNRAYERMLKSDVRYRFSIDLARLR